jgi:hypothetical protein
MKNFIFSVAKPRHLLNIFFIFISLPVVVFDFALTFTEHISFAVGQFIAFLAVLVFATFSIIEIIVLLKQRGKLMPIILVLILILFGISILLYFVPQLTAQQSKVLI